MFAVTNGDAQQLATLGVPGLIFVIIVMAGVIVFLYKDNRKITDERIKDAQAFGNKLAEPLDSLKIMSQRQADVTEKMYGILLDKRDK